MLTGRSLVRIQPCAIPLGEVAEWLNAAGLKPATPDRARGFKSHPLRLGLDLSIGAPLFSRDSSLWMTCSSLPRERLFDAVRCLCPRSFPVLGTKFPKPGERSTMSPVANRGSLKPDPELCAKLAALANDYRYSDTEFTDILLEYMFRDLDRVDAAIDERRQDGSRRARQRLLTPPKLVAAPSPQADAAKSTKRPHSN